LSQGVTLRVLRGEEDLVHSMMRSFFRRLRRGDFDLAGRDDLWSLLVTIFRNKARNAADRYFAALRDVRRVWPLPSHDASRSDAPNEVFALEAVEPTPAEATALNEAPGAATPAPPRARPAPGRPDEARGVYQP
jgi:hypothetical protein